MTGDTAQWITLLTVIAGFVYQAYRENRQRQWDKEDRAEAAAMLAAKVLTAAVKVSDQVERHAGHLSAAIELNNVKTDAATTAAHDAYKEANNVNNKISDLNARLLQQKKELQ